MFGCELHENPAIRVGIVLDRIQVSEDLAEDFRAEACPTDRLDVPSQPGVESLHALWDSSKIGHLGIDSAEIAILPLGEPEDDHGSNEKRRDCDPRVLHLLGQPPDGLSARSRPAGAGISSSRS